MTQPVVDRCQSCGADAKGGKFCPECGTKVERAPAVTKCPSCGTETKGARFCPECGTKMG
jgi:ribosomal protein L32